MWSLPDIQRLNAQASANAQETILPAVHQHLDSLGNPIHCDYCGNETEEVCPWFDIFGDDAKGVVAMCQEHYEKLGPVPEGYFWCDGCERLMAENYTWELYSVCTDRGCLCLNCYREDEPQTAQNWIPLTEPDGAYQFAVSIGVYVSTEEVE